MKKSKKMLKIYAIISQANIIANQSKKEGKMVAINYEKYSNMTERQLLTSLLNAEKKEIKMKADLQKKIKANSDLISFLKAKLKERIDKPKIKFISLKNSGHIEKANKYLNSLTSAEQAKLRQEVDDEINRDYGDEL